MRKYFVLIFLPLWASNAFSQTESARIQSRCKNIYVWDFIDQEKNKNRTTNDITEAVEEALTNIDQCFVLQRRNLANLVNQAAAERGVNSVKEMKRELTGALSGNGAKLVLFGTVDMSARDAYEVKLRIEDLSTSRILIVKSLRMLISDAANIESRNKVVTQLVNELVGKTVVDTEPAKNNDEKKPVKKAPTSGNVDFGIEIKDVFPGVGIIVESCVGDRIGQTITVNFTLVNNNSPNTMFRMAVSGIYAQPTPVANDPEGNTYNLIGVSLGGEKRVGRYSGSVEKELFAESRLRGSVTFGNVMPSVSKIVALRFPINLKRSHEYGGWNSITFSDLDITW